MDVRHLRHFLAIADELHFGRAARRLNMEQAPLSQSIKRFEAALGFALFERSRHGGTRITAAGARFVDDARKAVAQFDRAMAKAQGLPEQISAPVSIGFVTAALFEILPAGLKPFRRRFADADVRLSEGRTTELIEQVADGTLDLALINAPADRPAAVAFELLRRDRTIAAIPRSDPMARLRALRLRELAGEPLVFFPREASPDLHEGIKKAFRDLGAAPRVVQQASYTPTILALVAAGLGYALVQESARALPFADVVFRPLADLPAELTWDLHLAWNPGVAKASTRLLADFLRHAAAR